MKYIFIILLPSFLFANTPLENQDFDIKKFSGLWYEIARVENSFQTSCVASSVEYILQNDDSYYVYNRCFEKELDGKLIQYNGSAIKIEENNTSKLKMRYFLFFTQEYNITTIINSHDMNSVIEIGDNIIFINKKKKAWEGTNKMIYHAENQALNDFVFASVLYKQVKKANGLLVDWYEN